MLLVPCPWCGERPETEFWYGAEAIPPRGDLPITLDDDGFVDWLTGRRNPRGPLEERWWHQRGCGSWFTITRDTATHDILAASGDAP